MSPGSVGSRSPCRHTASRVACADDPSYPWAVGSVRQHPLTLRASASRGRWLQCASSRAGHPLHRPQDGALSPVCRDPSDWTRSFRLLRGGHTRRVQSCPLPIDPVSFSQAVQERSVESLPYYPRLPFTESAPTSHPGTVAHLLRKHLPRDARLEHEQNARKDRAGIDSRPAAFRFGRLAGQEWFDDRPQFVGYKRFCHAPPSYLRERFLGTPTNAVASRNVAHRLTVVEYR